MNPLGVGDPLRLGPYRLLGVLGEGGMGKVYLGQDTKGTFAAVKVLHPDLAHDAHLAQRFLREARAAQSVRSTGVAVVLDAQTEGGRPWIAAEYLAGPTLDEAVRTHGPFGEPGVRAIAASLGRTLGDVHAAGLIHRDIKPANIILTSDGPRLIDFGIARPEHGLTLTTTGQTPVTPGYGAPEQVLGKRVTPSADVFSLGAVLVYAATGRSAFDGPHVAAVQYEVVHGQPALEGLPKPLQPLVAPCLAKEPTARPAPAQVVSVAAPPRGAERAWKKGPLAAAIRERTEHVKRLDTATTAVPSGRQHTRRSLLVSGAAVGGVLAAGGGTAAWWLHRRAAEKDGLFSFPPAARTPLAPLQKMSKDPYKNRPEKLWSISTVDTGSRVPLPVRDVLVVGISEGGIAAYDVRTGKRRWRAPAVRAKGGFLSLADRLVIAADAGGALRTFVASTGESKWAADADAEKLLAADGQAVYVVTKDGRLRAVGRSDARIRWTAQLPADFGKKLTRAAVAGSGRLVVVGTDGRVLAVDTRDGRRVWERNDKMSEDDTVRPTLRNGTVYLNGVMLRAHRLSDGTEVWADNNMYKSDTGGWGPCVSAEDALYGLDQGTPVKLSPANGKRIWRSEAFVSHHVSLAEQGSGVWFVDDSGVFGAIAKSDGEEVVFLPVGGATYYAVAAGGNRCFLVHDHKLSAVAVF